MQFYASVVQAHVSGNNAGVRWNMSTFCYMAKANAERVRVVWEVVVESDGNSVYGLLSDVKVGQHSRLYV